MVWVHHGFLLTWAQPFFWILCPNRFEAAFREGLRRVPGVPELLGISPGLVLCALVLFWVALRRNDSFNTG